MVLTMSACSSGYPIHSNSRRALKSGRAFRNIPATRCLKYTLLLPHRIENTGLTTHQVQHISLLIRPMQSQRPYPSRELRICLHSIKYIQPTMQTLLVLSEIEIDGLEDDVRCDVAVEGGDGEPGAEVETWDEVRYAFPDLWGDAFVGGGM